MISSKMTEKIGCLLHDFIRSLCTSTGMKSSTYKKLRTSIPYLFPAHASNTQEDKSNATHQPPLISILICSSLHPLFSGYFQPPYPECRGGESSEYENKASTLDSDRGLRFGGVVNSPTTPPPSRPLSEPFDPPPRLAFSSSSSVRERDRTWPSRPVRECAGEEGCLECREKCRQRTYGGQLNHLLTCEFFLFLSRRFGF